MDFCSQGASLSISIEQGIRTNPASIAGVRRLLTLSCLLMGLTCSASASHLCLNNDVVVGLIATEYSTLRNQLGCPLSVERDVPGADGRYNDFENGQIVWSPTQQLLVAAYQTTKAHQSVLTPTETTGSIVVSWKVTGSFTYDFFIVRWLDVADPVPGDPSHSTQFNVPVPTSGSYIIDIPQGRYQITVEGCNKGGFLGPSHCNQGWSNPVFVDAGLTTDPCCSTWPTLDISHKVLPDARGNTVPLLPARTPAEVNNAFDDHVTIGFRPSCSQSFATPGSLNSDFAWQALGKLYLSDLPQLSDCPSPSQMVSDVNNALRGATVTSDVGTNSIATGCTADAEGGISGFLAGGAFGFVLGGPGGSALGAILGAFGGAAYEAEETRPGDYDMALSHLVPLMYRYSSRLDGDVRTHVLHDLLNQTGGAANVRTQWSACGINVPETENHIMMTESARYLTNQLLLAEARAGDPAKLPAAQASYDNRLNGLQDWMLDHLQGFLKHDFHEYNARPYSNNTLRAIHNLAEYADPPVSQAASMVLDYLMAKLAVSSSGLRRSVPFRRHYDSMGYAPLYDEKTDNNDLHDQSAWVEPTFFANTRIFENLRHGHLSWKAAGDMSSAALGKYRAPDIILDLVLQGEAVSSQQSPTVSYFQTYRHEGVEVYARSPDFLISAGGDWEDNTSADKVLGLSLFSGADTNGAALPTTLMPTWEGTTQDDLLKIEGNPDPKKRANACVVTGFACGLHPTYPTAWLQSYKRLPRPCSQPVIGLIQSKWKELGSENGPLGCPLSPESSLSSGGAIQAFERGQIEWSQPQKLMVAVYFQKGQPGFGVNWNITDQYHYDFFLVRWDRDGVNVGQQQIENSDPNTTPTSGSWSIPDNGTGSYQVVIEGCDGHFLSSSTCRQGWSGPILFHNPAPNSCYSVNGNWTFFDRTEQCGAPPQQGFSVAFYSAPCTSSCFFLNIWQPLGTFGFFEAAEERDISFADFEARTLRNNGSKTYRSNAVNRYVTSDDRSIDFRPDHSQGQWGILQMTDQPASPDTTQ